MADEKITTLTFGVRGTALAQQNIARINAAYAKLNREVGSTGKLVQTLYNANKGSEKAQVQIDHLADAFKRLSKNAQDAGQSVAATTYAVDHLTGTGGKGDLDLPGTGGKGGSHNGYTGGRHPLWRSRNRQGWIRRPAMMVGGLLGLGGFGAITAGIAQAEQYVVTLSDLGKQAQLTAAEHDKLSASVKATSAVLGISYNEMTRYIKGFATLTGTTEGAMVPALFARGMGMDLGTTTQGFGELGRLGAVSRNKIGMTELAAVFASAIAKGNFQGRQEELLRSLVGFASAQTRILGSAQGTAQFLSALTTLNAHGPAGLKGELGAQYLSNLSEGIRHPGGGGTGLYLMSQALGEKDFFRLKFRQEEGAFGPGNNLSSIMPYLRNLLPGNDRNSRLQRAMLTSELFPGTSMHENMAFEKIYSRYGALNIGSLHKWLGRHGFSKGLDNIKPEQFSILMRMRNLKNGDSAGLEKVLSSPELAGMSQEEKDKLVKSGNIDEALQAVSKQTFATDADKTRVELEKIDQHLMDFGEKAVWWLTDVAGEINHGFDWVRSRWPDAKAAKAALNNYDQAAKDVDSYLDQSPFHKMWRWILQTPARTRVNPERSIRAPRPDDLSMLSPSAAYADVEGLTPRDFNFNWGKGQTGPYNGALTGISRVESGGNYNARNPHSGAAGKYQIMPGTWRQFAPMAGLSPNAPMTPENQERVAMVMQRYYAKRYSGDPRLIAAAWYGGQGTADALATGKMSSHSFYRPQYSKGHMYPSIASYIEKAAGTQWHIGDQATSSPEYLNSLAVQAGQLGSQTGDSKQLTVNTSLYLNKEHIARTTRTGNGTSNSYTPPYTLEELTELIEQ